MRYAVLFLAAIVGAGLFWKLGSMHRPGIGNIANNGTNGTPAPEGGAGSNPGCMTIDPCSGRRRLRQPACARLSRVAEGQHSRAGRLRPFQALPEYNAR